MALGYDNLNPRQKRVYVFFSLGGRGGGGVCGIIAYG